MGDATIKNFGVVIAICGALFVFGGQTFAIWSFGLEVDLDDGDESSLTFLFGAEELYLEFDGDDAPDDNDVKYDDDDEDLDDLEDFFANLKLMFYALIGCGIGLAYIGNSGGNMESIPTIAGVTALLSVVIMAYTFTSLPEAFEEDTEMFENIDEDPSFFVNKERDDDGGDIHLKAMPHVGFFLPVVSLTLAGLLINPRLMD